MHKQSLSDKVTGVVYFDQQTHDCACIRMVENDGKHSKIIKSTFFIMRTRGSCKAREEKWREKFVGQKLGVTPKSWLTPKRWLLIWNFVKLFSSFFFMSLRWASHTHDGIGTFFIILQCFSSFLTMQTHAQACVCWSKYATDRQALK